MTEPDKYTAPFFYGLPEEFQKMLVFDSGAF
jgi:hypothetical protein